MSSNKQTTIGEIAEVFDGPHATPKKTETGPYFLSISSLKSGALDLSQSAHLSEEDFKKWTKRVTPEQGDVLFSYETRLGEAALMPDGIRACLGRRMGLMRPDRSKVISEYLLYAYLAPEFQKTIEARKIHGATVDRIALKELPDFPIRIPELSEQEAVAGVLKRLDVKIELNRRINQTLEQIAQAIFKSWFVDFEPVKAKIAGLEAGGTESDIQLAAMQAISGRDPEQLAQMRTKQPEKYTELYSTAELFPSAMQDSELGKIPEGWTVGTLSDLLEFNPRRTLRKGVVAPYLDMKNVPTSGHLADEITERQVGSGTKFINGDTLLARITPCLENGKTAFVDFLNSGETGWGSTEYIVLRPKASYPVSLGYFIARNEAFRSAAIQSMTGTSGRQRASAKALADLPWVNYPPELVDRFDTVAGSYLRLAKRYGDEIKSLAQIRDVLLPKLLSGELTLPETDPQTELQEVANV
ncbi:restriction endonuclease subunit S [Marinobacter sp. S0848L]|uniref:restriction endonuclease subunit S n=1 Tax=Marinobacter sp. S0848L TaxID=2926423 RepID=UPI001FF6FBEC|nr:restriction endonuclease subunit S [Marinobacter sp. S0848L]MCK0106951.1 restriction endonuclease subunit S [Marinobacter sp. S0848L]